MEIPFAAVHQIVRAVDDFVDRLPAPQRAALEVTFGVRAGAVPDRFVVAVATLSLVSEAAQERPLLCVVDDAQWLDRTSAQNRADAKRQTLADEEWKTVQDEGRQNEQLLALSKQILDLTKEVHANYQSTSGPRAR